MAGVSELVVEWIEWSSGSSAYDVPTKHVAHAVPVFMCLVILTGGAVFPEHSKISV